MPLDRRSRPMGLPFEAHRRMRVVGWGQRVMALLSVALPFVLVSLLSNPLPAEAAPGLCTGPVCADAITRSAKNHWQLVLRLEDQQGHREKVVPPEEMKRRQEEAHATFHALHDVAQIQLWAKEGAGLSVCAYVTDAILH